MNVCRYTNRLMVLTLFMILSISGFSQIRKITDQVVDKKTRQPVRDAIVIVYGSPDGTTTNFLGYFQLDVADGFDKLIISHINYEVSELVIPEDDKLLISLNPAVTLLQVLDLSLFPRKANPNKQDSIERLAQPVTLMDLPEYQYGWEEFYWRLGNLIVLDSQFVRTSFFTTVQFTVNENSELQDLKGDTITNSEVIIRNLNTMQAWRPAIQNGKFIAHKFWLTVASEKSVVDRYLDSMKALEERPLDFYDYIVGNFDYPVQARKRGIEGFIYLQLEVDADGRIQDTQILQGIGAGCEEEVIEFIKRYPRIDPATISYRPGRYVLPIFFSIGSPKDKIVELDSTLGNMLPSVAIAAIKPKTVVVPEELFYRVGGMQFPGGGEAFKDYMVKHKQKIEVPIPPNRSNNTVRLEFTILPNGELTDFKVIAGLGQPFDDEAIRLYDEMPAWQPRWTFSAPRRTEGFADVDFNNIPENNRERAKDLTNAGKFLYDRGKFEKALTKFSEAIAKNPTVLNIYFDRAATFIKLGRIEEACADLSLIRERDQEALLLFKIHCSEN